jgi:myosin-5
MSKVFIPDDEHIWVAAELLFEDRDSGMVEVKVEDDEIGDGGSTSKASSGSSKKNRVIQLSKYNLDSLPLQNLDLPKEGVPDMCSLSYLHEASILDNLKRRFKHKFPYTYTGEICIAMNPYQWLQIYTPQLRESYSTTLRHQMEPHVYATSAAAYNVGLVKRGKNQSILVSGESGAGKTETVKILMNHLASIASRKGEETIDKLLKANPLLESFGNAKTARNDNSSRFGKFSQLQFDPQNILVGSRCITYLLEKSRVVGQSSAQERNYHVLYQLLAAQDAEGEQSKQRLWLEDKSCTDFKYMCEGDTETDHIEGVSDADRYSLTMEALQLLGVSGDLRVMLERALAGVLYLGEVTMGEVDGHSDQCFIHMDDEDVMEYESSTDTVTTRNSVERCCDLLGLGVDGSAFSAAVASRTLDVEGKVLSVPLNVEQGMSGRDALAKELYERIFQWLVLVINFNTSYRSSDNKSGNKASKAKRSAMSTISLLDIFGFESFGTNRFEQLCINYANEKLQQKFTMDVFKTVQEEVY